MQVIFELFFPLDLLLILLATFAATPHGPQDKEGNSLEQQ